MKEYVGQRNELTGELEVTVVAGDDRPRPLHHVVQHSPDGFEAGYGGSGPADLALSILADALEERPSADELRHGRAICLRHHQEFKREVVARLEPPFTIPGEDVEAFLTARGVDPAGSAWFRVLLPEHPTARNALAMTLYTNAESLLDAAADAPDEGAADALREAAYELYSALDIAGLGEPEEAGSEEV